MRKPTNKPDGVDRHFTCRSLASIGNLLSALKIGRSKRSTRLAESGKGKKMKTTILIRVTVKQLANNAAASASN